MPMAQVRSAIQLDGAHGSDPPDARSSAPVMYLSLGIVASSPKRYSSGMGSAAAGYRPRAPEHGVLHTVVRTHLEAFLREAAERADGAGLPRFAEDEFRDFLTCGILDHGFARLRCDGCGLDHICRVYLHGDSLSARVSRVRCRFRARTASLPTPEDDPRAPYTHDSQSRGPGITTQNIGSS
jgi:hypothetical protein